MVKRHYEEEELLKYIQLDPNITNFNGRTLLLHFDSFCLGDTICFSSFIDPFIEYHKPKKIYISTFFPHLFQSKDVDRCEFIKANNPVYIEVDRLLDIGYDKGNLKHTLNGMMYATKDTMMLPQDTKPGKCPVIPYKINKKNNIYGFISIVTYLFLANFSSLLLSPFLGIGPLDPNGFNSYKLSLPPNIFCNASLVC